MLEYLIAVPIIIIMFYVHEIGHSIECYRQTGNYGSITIDIHGLTMYCSCVIFDELEDETRLKLMGGLFAGAVSFILGTVFMFIDEPVSYGFCLAGMMNLMYAPYEAYSKDNKRITS